MLPIVYGTVADVGVFVFGLTAPVTVFAVPKGTDAPLLSVTAVGKPVELFTVKEEPSS